MTTLIATGPTHVTVPSPVGPLTIVAQGGKIAGLYMDAQRHAPEAASFGLPGDPADEPFAAAAAQLAAYFDGDLTEFDLPLAPVGTVYQQRVWRALCAIPYGATRSYLDISHTAGGSPRSVGQANGNNPIPIVIPCHRVLATTHIGGYSGGDGLPTKRWLLALEARAQPLLLPTPSAAA